MDLIVKPVLLLALTCGCSPSIPLPAPGELSVKQIAYGPTGAVEVSWKLVLKVDGYLVHYDDDQPGGPYHGKGLYLVQWPAGCGDFDGGTGDTSSIAADSPIHIPVEWCLDWEQGLSDAGLVPVETPATRPRVRLQNLVAGRTYYFTVQAFRGDAASRLSGEVSIAIEDEPSN